MEENNKKINFELKSFLSKSNMPLLALIIDIILAVIFIIISAVVFKISIIPCCVIAILEVILAVCFNKIPIWIHGLIFIAQVEAGVLSSHIGFMALMALIYVCSIAFLYIWERHE